MTNTIDHERLMVAKIRADKSLMFFTRFFYKELNNRKFIVNDHHTRMVKSLDKIERYELKLLNINMPPRFSKTELAAVNFIARGLAMNPTANYLYITASDELRSQTSVAIRNIVTCPAFKAMYNVDLRKDQNGKNLWRTKQGGGVKTATIFGQVTGFGAGQMVEHQKLKEEHEKDLLEYIREFEGCQVWDDLNKIDDATQENANNQKVSRVIFSTLLSRENSADTPIINIQQRAGMSDATSQLQEHFVDDPKAEFLVMPVIKDGVPLWKWKLDVEAIEKMKTSTKTSHTFETQYMQNPIPLKGLLLPKDKLKRFKLKDLEEEALIESIKFSYTDTADEGNDYWCSGYVAVIGHEIYLLDVLLTQDDADICIPEHASRIKQHKVKNNKIETNREGRMTIKIIRKEFEEKEFSSYDITGHWSKGSKLTRMIATASTVKSHVIFREDYEPNSEYDLFMRMITTFPKDGSGKFDDPNDMLAGLTTYVTHNLPHLY